MSARLLLAGTVVRMEDESQVTVNVIETQTTRVLGSVNEIFDGAARLSEISRSVTDALRKKLPELMPVRTRISEVGGKRAKVPIGRTLGVSPGDHFALQSADGSTPLGDALVPIVEVADDFAWLELKDGGKLKKDARAELSR